MVGIWKISGRMYDFLRGGAAPKERVEHAPGETLA